MFNLEQAWIWQVANIKAMNALHAHPDIDFSSFLILSVFWMLDLFSKVASATCLRTSLPKNERGVIKLTNLRLFRSVRFHVNMEKVQAARKTG